MHINQAWIMDMNKNEQRQSTIVLLKKNVQLGNDPGPFRRRTPFVEKITCFVGRERFLIIFIDNPNYLLILIIAVLRIRNTMMDNLDPFLHFDVDPDPTFQFSL
jgi:hypothetical protein